MYTARLWPTNNTGSAYRYTLLTRPIDDKIAPHAEQDQQIQDRKEEVVVEYELKAADGRVHEPASCDEHESAMEFRPFPPINGEPNAHAKSDHVVERNRQKCICVVLMELTVSNRAMMMAMATPSGTITVASPAPNQPRKRCQLTLCTRTNVDCAMKKTTHVENAAP